MHYSKFKTKTIFTLGIYQFVWRHHVATLLRDNYGAQLKPGTEVGSMFVPIWGLFVFWHFLTTIRDTQRAAGLTHVLSAGRAFWWSSLWFGAGPYVNRHLNLLAATKAAAVLR